MHEDGCDNCGNIRELYHFDAEVEGNPDDGAALCDECNSEANAWDDAHREGEAEVGPFHAELRQIIEQVEGTPLAALVPHAEALLALPEESVAALVDAAQSMVVGASAGR